MQKSLARILVVLNGVFAISGQSVLTRQQSLLGNTSVLPPGWSQNPGIDCIADCVIVDTESNLPSQILFGPSFTDPVGLTIESCVVFCNAQGSRLAGLQGYECKCSNIYNPSSCFESDDGECSFAGFANSCPGNPVESCGLQNGEPSLFNLFLNSDSQFNCSFPVWPGGAALTPGGGSQWRFSYFYNDSITGRALGRNSVNLKVPVPRGNMSTEICTTACGNAGFTLAGVEYADECYCGNTIENNAHPLTNCDVLPTIFDVDINSRSTLMPCSGNKNEFCGGPNIVSIYTLSGTGLVPLIPFDPELDNFCSGFDCVGHT